MTKALIVAALLAVGAAEPPQIEPDAIAALRKMGAFLREQQSFTVGTRSYTDYVLDSGQAVRLSSRGELRVQRPDHLRAEVESDRKDRQYFYDGKTFTIYAPKVGYYAQIPEAPGSLREVADSLAQRYGIQLPLVDLFRWGTSESDIDEITSATYIGRAKVDGVETDQYAFRQRGLDWQIWIERGDRPVPRKLVLTTTDDPARPEHGVELTWQLGTQFEGSIFTFVPPEDSHRIAIRELAPPHNPG